MGWTNCQRKTVLTGDVRAVSAYAVIESDYPQIKEFCERFLNRAEAETACRRIVFTTSLSDQEKQMLSDTLEIQFPIGEEAHIIQTGEEEIRVYSPSFRGLLYGASELARFFAGGSCRQFCFFNSPVCDVRGMKAFLPSRENIPFFRKFIDILAFYKFNTVMLEIGGAMQYQRHPEINEGWIRYCAEMAEYSGKTKKIQDETYPWYKNAIHMENGGGQYLSQEEVRDLVQYCRDRGMEVIPEVPSLGHCDYLLLGHQDLAERADDPYPDTYCPSNPASYELLFDVIDEVVDVFRPSIMNIGHDEYYSIGICDRCCGRDAADLFAQDVNKISDYLENRGVRTMIWGDKLLKNAEVPGAGPFGGAEIRMYTPAFHVKDGKFVGIMPATWPAVSKVKRDTVILHWCWALGEELEEEILNARFPMLYGNFDSYLFPAWKEHADRGGGAMISNWSSLNEVILQRNGIFFNIAYAFRMFWDPAFSDDGFREIQRQVIQDLYVLKNPARKAMHETGSAHPPHVEITWNTDYNPEFEWFVDGVFPEEEKYHMGDVVFLYTDGTSRCVPVLYGENIGYMYADWERCWEDNHASYKVDDRLIGTTYGTRPEQRGGETVYSCLLENPCTDRELEDISVETRGERYGRIQVYQVRKLML